MFDFNKPNIEITEISEDKKYGRFVVEPLERGYGTTLGNSLRRIMLSSLPGAAISQVKIDGVLHEFSSIPGVKEDVTEIIMNLKSLAIKNTSETDEPKTAYIEFEGEGVVTGADIQADQDIEIMNPETVIATLNGGADSKLYMELTITKGRGYVSADKNKNEELPIAVIPIDSIYTPVERVNLTVEYYNKTTTDLLFEVPTSVVTGFESNWENLGKLRNSGVEIEINSQNIKNEDFTWDTNFNLTFQKAIIKELPNGDDIQYGDGDMYLHREDESMYTFYLPEWKGVNPETGLGEFWKDPNDHSKGVVNYYDEAGKGIVGKAIPDVMGGMTNSFTYKDFDLSFLITYQFGGDIFDYPNYFFRSDGFRLGSFNVEKSVAGDYWMNPGDNVSYPKPIYANPYRSYAPDRLSGRRRRVSTRTFR